MPNPMCPNDRKIQYDVAERIPSWKDFFASLLICKGYDIFLKGGEDYKIPVSVVTSTNEYKAETDYFSEFFGDNLEVTLRKDGLSSGTTCTCASRSTSARTTPTRWCRPRRWSNRRSRPSSRSRAASGFNAGRTFVGWTHLKYKV